MGFGLLGGRVCLEWQLLLLAVGSTSCSLGPAASFTSLATLSTSPTLFLLPHRY